MSRKAPRRTAERILETALEMFNRFGEPNVSTTAISTEMGISPGNLYYHYPAKDELVNALFERHRQALAPLLVAGGEVRDVEAAIGVNAISSVAIGGQSSIVADQLTHACLASLMANRHRVYEICGEAAGSP